MTRLAPKNDRRKKRLNTALQATPVNVANIVQRLYESCLANAVLKSWGAPKLKRSAVYQCLTYFKLFHFITCSL